ncbi:hypothetical protein L6164_029639 [Bauhinia variegata]|uniref:Uncharacterized protein n=1 Tax=Bauhinia variegata TaxID=167791 RepID=A0ACB9L999_BAUVA|nr:hypothetical protein L6164_029639 [Bauhinia variegata]
MAVADSLLVLSQVTNTRPKVKKGRKRLSFFLDKLQQLEASHDQLHTDLHLKLWSWICCRSQFVISFLSFRIGVFESFPFCHKVPGNR